MKTLEERLTSLLSSEALNQAEKDEISNILQGNDTKLTMWDITVLELKAKGIKG